MNGDAFISTETESLDHSISSISSLGSFSSSLEDAGSSRRRS